MPDRDRKDTSRPDAFDRAVANLRRNWNQFHADGLAFYTWQELTPESKVAFLATEAARLDVPFERFVKAAHHVLGAEEFSPDDEWHLRRQFREARELYGRKVSFADLKAEGQGKQPGRQKTRSKGMER